MVRARLSRARSPSRSVNSERRGNCVCVCVCVCLTQANTLTPFLACVRSSLDAAMCLRAQPSQNVERHNQPEVETRCVVS